MIDLRKKFLGAILELKLPGFDSGMVSENLICNYVVALSRVTFEKIKQFVSVTDSYVVAQFDRRVAETNSGAEWANFHPGNRSLFMSYDFHVDNQGQPRLIEINTNAAFLFLADLLYQVAELPHPVADFQLGQIKIDLETEMRLALGRDLKKILIVDEDPQGQRLYVEFLVAQKIFEGFGYDSSIQDVGRISTVPDMIYNRSTDFYFAHAISANIRDMYKSKRVCLTPNPHEYYWFSDKRRLTEWCADPNLPTLMAETLLKSRVIDASNRDPMWANRKSLFFKPVTAYGSKQSFKGASMSRKLYDEISLSGMLAQEYVAAPEVETEFGRLKYDLRVYTYQGRVQSAVARLYEGQVTNLRSPHGGFAPIRLF